MQVIELKPGVDFDKSSHTVVRDNEYIVFEPKKSGGGVAYCGFKSEGVSACFAFIACLLIEDRYIPIALGHFVPVASDEDVDDARIDVECFLDRMNKDIDNIYGADCSIYYTVLGGVESSRNTFDALNIIRDEGQYGINDIYFNIAPTEDSGVDVYVDARAIYYSKHIDYAHAHRFGQDHAARLDKVDLDAVVTLEGMGSRIRLVDDRSLVLSEESAVSAPAPKFSL